MGLKVASSCIQLLSLTLKLHQKHRFYDKLRFVTQNLFNENYSDIIFQNVVPNCELL